MKRYVVLCLPFFVFLMGVTSVEKIYAKAITDVQSDRSAYMDEMDNRFFPVLFSLDKESEVMDADFSLPRETSMTKEDRGEFELLGITGNLIKNGDFEQISSYWSGAFKDSDTGWHDLGPYYMDNYVINNNNNQDSYVAELNDVALASDPFSLPVNTSEIVVSYDGEFLYSGSACKFEENRFFVGVYDVDLDEYIGYGFHDPNEQSSDTEMTPYSFTFSNINAHLGHEAELIFMPIHNYSSCSIQLNLDNVSLTATTSDACTGNQCKVYRFWSDKKQGHFYTMSEAEANSIIETYPRNVWKYEGVSWEAKNAQDSGTYPIYRFWSDEKQHHFYTISEAEKNHVIATYPESVWKYEGIAYYAYPLQESNTKPVYRFWSDQKQGHFYTSSSAEKDSIIATYPERVWKYEGIAWYVGE